MGQHFLPMGIRGGGQLDQACHLHASQRPDEFHAPAGCFLLSAQELLHLLVHRHGKLHGRMAVLQILIHRHPVWGRGAAHLLNDGGLADAPLRCEHNALLLDDLPEMEDEGIAPNDGV